MRLCALQVSQHSQELWWLRGSVPGCFHHCGSRCSPPLTGGHEKLGRTHRVSSLRWVCGRLNVGSHESERASGRHAWRAGAARPPSHNCALWSGRAETAPLRGACRAEPAVGQLPAEARRRPPVTCLTSGGRSLYEPRALKCQA